MKLHTYHNGDDVFIAWKLDGAIDNCRGFALLRRRNGTEETVQTWVGFAGQTHTEGEHRDSTQWPIQRYQWTDYMANPGDSLAYKVIHGRPGPRPPQPRRSQRQRLVGRDHPHPRGITACRGLFQPRD